jgi:tetratricopeptide (TPR) repeat protein
MSADDIKPADRADLARAKKLLSEKKYDRALPVLERLYSIYPKTKIVKDLYKMAAAGFEGKEEEEKEIHSAPQEAASTEVDMHAFYRDLGIDFNEGDQGDNLRHVFAPILSSVFAQRISVDLSVFLAAQNGWDAALSVVDRLLKGASASRPEIMLWKMRCLLETERYSEVIAMAAGNWPPAYQLPLNYLLGRAYQALGVKDQARNRFEAVKRLNPGYRDVAIRLRTV